MDGTIRKEVRGQCWMLGEVPGHPYSLAAQLHMAQDRGREPKMLLTPGQGSGTQNVEIAPKKKAKNKSVWSRKKIKSLIGYEYIMSIHD